MLADRRNPVIWYVRPLRVSAGVALLFASIALHGCGLNCDNAACFDGAEIGFTHSAPVSSLEGGHLRVCRDDLCSDGSISGSDVAFSVNDLAITHASVHLDVLSVSVPPTTGVRLENGDVYTIELRDNAGTVVASKRWEATYMMVYPNGDDCGGSCRVAYLD